jgi:APA family basic amino acid/polyamine antiporter
MENRLFAKKPSDLLTSEAQDASRHTLKRTIGPFQLVALGIGAIIGAASSL